MADGTAAHRLRRSPHAHVRARRGSPGCPELARLRPGLALDATFYGRGDALPALEALAADLGIAASIHFPGRIPIEDVPAVVAAADLGVAPTRLDPFTGMSLSTKLLEYAAMGKPVVASSLPTVERYFEAGTLTLYEPGDHESLAGAILTLPRRSGPEERAGGANSGQGRRAGLGPRGRGLPARCRQADRPRVRARPSR